MKTETATEHMATKNMVGRTPRLPYALSRAPRPQELSMGTSQRPQSCSKFFGRRNPQIQTRPKTCLQAACALSHDSSATTQDLADLATRRCSVATEHFAQQ